jgi:UDP-glucose 4-epimerase
MRVFITGIAGFLGSHLAERFLEQGHEVVGCDNLLGGYLDNVPAKAEFYQYDCTYLNSMVKISRGCDVFYHCAATAYEGLSVFSPHLVTKNIVEASVAVITAAIVNKARRFVLCSSMARYGRGQTPFREDATPAPVDPYGIGKYATELYLANLATTHGMEWTIAVPHNIIGPRQKYDDPYRNVAAIMINLMLQGREPIIYGDGNQRRCFSFVQDCVSSLEKMATLPAAVGEVINIGPDEEFVSINQLAATLAKLLGRDCKPLYVPDRPQEVKEATCSADKARRLLGYKTEYDLDRGLREMIEWIKQRGPKPFRYHLDLEIVTDKTPRTWKDRLF